MICAKFDGNMLTFKVIVKRNLAYFFVDTVNKVKQLNVTQQKDQYGLLSLWLTAWLSNHIQYQGSVNTPKKVILAGPKTC